MTQNNKISLAVLSFSALICISGVFSFSFDTTPIPIVLQNFFVILAASLLGPTQGAATCGLFLIAGIIYPPIFAGCHGLGFGQGMLYLSGQTGGYIIGYFLAAIVTGFYTGKPRHSKTPLVKIIIGSLLGFLVIYIPGVIRFLRVNEIPLSIETISPIIDICIRPFIFGDLIKLCAVIPLAFAFRPYCEKLLFSTKESSTLKKS